MSAGVDAVHVPEGGCQPQGLGMDGACLAGAAQFGEYLAVQGDDACVVRPQLASPGDVGLGASSVQPHGMGQSAVGEVVSRPGFEADRLAERRQGGIRAAEHQQRPADLGVALGVVRGCRGGRHRRLEGRLGLIEALVALAEQLQRGSIVRCHAQGGLDDVQGRCGTPGLEQQPGPLQVGVVVHDVGSPSTPPRAHSPTARRYPMSWSSWRPR